MFLLYEKAPEEQNIGLICAFQNHGHVMELVCAKFFQSRHEDPCFLKLRSYFPHFIHPHKIIIMSSLSFPFSICYHTFNIPSPWSRDCHLFSFLSFIFHFSSFWLNLPSQARTSHSFPLFRLLFLLPSFPCPAIVAMYFFRDTSFKGSGTLRDGGTSRVGGTSRIGDYGWVGRTGRVGVWHRQGRWHQ